MTNSIEANNEWVLTSMDQHGKKGDTKHPSERSALIHAASLIRQKGILLGLKGPDKSYDAASLRLSAREYENR